MPRLDITPNTLLQEARRRVRSRLRHGKCLSQSELATEVNTYLHDHNVLHLDVDAGYISKIEAGRIRWPREQWRRHAFRAVLRVDTDAEIGFYPTRRSTKDAGIAAVTGPAAVVEADPLRGASGSATEPPVPLLPANEVVRRDNARPGGDWNSFSIVTGMLAQQRQAVAPAALLALVEAHRDCLLALFRKAETDQVRADIGAMLGEASIVASRLWSAQGNRSMAIAHCAYARTLADRLGDVRLGAIARIFESNLHSEASTLIHADGDVVTGLRLLDESAAHGAYLGPAAQARIAAEQAQAYASLGMRKETEAALDRAQRAASGITACDRTGLFSDWNPTRLQVYEGTCRLLLGEPVAAARACS